MKRITIVVVAVAALILTGCSAGPEQTSTPAPSETSSSAPTPEPIKAGADAEAAYISALVASMPPGADSADTRAAVLDLGYRMCENARDQGGTTTEMAQVYIDALDPEDESWMLMMGTALLAGKHAGEQLCPEYAG